MDAMMRLVLLLGLVVGCVNAACPPDFVASVTIPGKCYHINMNTTFDFFSAINYCRNLTYGADILAIANGFENSEVASLLQSQGISDALIGNAFYDNKSHWIATAAGSSNYSNWGSGIWNDLVAFVYSSGSWSYTSSRSYYGTICQIYPDDPTTFPPPQITCPAGWTPSISVRGKCYKLIGTTDFFSATKECLTTRIGDSHAELVTLTSQLEMMELSATQPPNYVWASLTSWEADGHWHWVETLHPTDYFGLYVPPLNDEETCALINNDNLAGASCGGIRAAICQYFPDEPPAPTPPSLICPQNGIASITKPGTCYYVLSQNQTFQSARNACQALNTGFTHNDLFVPRTKIEYEEFDAIVRNQTSFPPVWLGLINSNGNWGWISGQPSNITNIWCDEQPDTSQNPNNQCGFINTTPRYIIRQLCWTAGNCTDSYPAICQSSNTF